MRALHPDAEQALREIETFSPAARRRGVVPRSAMARPLFCVKFTNDSTMVVNVDVAAKDAGEAIVAATNQLHDVFDGPLPDFRPVEVYPVEIR